MSRRQQIIIAVCALLVLLAAALGASLVDRQDSPAEIRAAEERQEQTEDLCASRQTFEGLKQAVFAEAAKRRSGPDVNFDVLSASAFARMEEPAVEGRDEERGAVACRGRFILELPPGAEAGFNGQRRLTADITYEIQPAADGSGPVYRISGAENIIAQLAAFALEGRRLQMPETPLEDGIDNEVAPVETDEPEPPVVDPAPPVQVPRPVANPSFDCDDARTRGERMVCASPALAAKDRAMAAYFYAAMDDADRRQRRLLEATRNRFLAYRDRCGSEACISQAYDGRMREIRDIMTGDY